MGVNFCWECGGKLRGNFSDTRQVEGRSRILHKDCAKRIDAGDRDNIAMDHERIPVDPEHVALRAKRDK